MKLESIGITLVSGRFANCQTSVCKQYIYIRYGDETAWDETARGRNDHLTLVKRKTLKNLLCRKSDDSTCEGRVLAAT